MAAPSAATKAAVATGFVAAVVAIVVGVGLGRRESAPGFRRSIIRWQDDGGVPSGEVRCLRQYGYATSEALAILGLDAGRGQSAYGAVVACGLALPDGGAEQPELPSGFIVVETSQEEVAWDGGPQIFSVLQGEVELECSCSTGSNCQARGADGGWVTAATGNTLAAGQWQGTGCFRKVCNELAGTSSWPSECPP